MAEATVVGVAFFHAELQFAGTDRHGRRACSAVIVVAG
jgi:hypothetical protein